MGYIFISSDDDDDYDNNKHSNEQNPSSKIIKAEPVISFSAYSTTTTKKQKRNNNKSQPIKKKHKKLPNITKISFINPTFDIIELDDDGNVIDKGDDDFLPCKRWNGRKGGFEFKLGERGLGYYRTGKKVVVPSNSCSDSFLSIYLH